MERMAYLSVELVDKHHRFLFRLLSSAGKVRSYPTSGRRSRQGG